MMKIEEIIKLIPHRPPFLLIDRVIEYDFGNSLTAIKNVTIGEPFFSGHFPDRPIMPGVLIIEALAQAGGILAYKSQPQINNDAVLLLGIDKARFKRPVVPGDLLYLKVEYLNKHKKVHKIKGTALVENQIICTAELIASI